MPVFRVLTIATVVLALASTALTQPQTPRSPAERAAAQQAEHDKLMAMPRPIDAVDSVWLAELTWLEVRDAQRAGKTTILVVTGGVEQNGPYLATGKHQYINHVTCEAVARKLGNALCAPIVPFVPQGDIDPPSGMMLYPGSIGVTESTYQALLTDLANSFRVTGFEHVILMGDSGGNQRGMKEVASALSAKWTGSKSRIHYIPEYYNWGPATEFAEKSLGWKQSNDGNHDDAVSSALMMTADPNSVRIKQRIAKGKATINGISLTPIDKVIAGGKQITNWRADQTVAAIKKAVAGVITSQRQ
jgi:creatinine amidohydrolase